MLAAFDLSPHGGLHLLSEGCCCSECLICWCPRSLMAVACAASGASTASAPHSNSHAAAIAAGILVPLVVIALAAGVAVIVMRRRRQQRRTAPGPSFQITAWSAATYDPREDYVALPVPLRETYVSRGQFMTS